MKWPRTRAQWICAAISLYWAWGIVDTLLLYKFSQPKALAGSVIGFVAFGLMALTWNPEVKNKDKHDQI
jgi:hypothetical protein